MCYRQSVLDFDRISSTPSQHGSNCNTPRTLLPTPVPPDPPNSQSQHILRQDKQFLALRPVKPRDVGG